MTATVKPPKGASARRTLRFSSLESLGFSDAAFTWSDTPTVDTGTNSSRGRHETTVADLEPIEFGQQLSGGNVRWSLVALIALILGGVGVFGYWLYQRPIVMEQAVMAEVSVAAESLEAQLPLLIAANEELGDTEAVPDTATLATVESDARALFELSGSVGDFETRVAASEAAAATLDALRLVRETGSYRAAVAPALTAPPLETDPQAIALDEAARSFGNWQLSYTGMRSALPDGVLPRVSQQLDVISTDLTRVLGDYVDALRADDQQAADRTLSTLDARLVEVGATMDQSIADIQSRVELQLAEATSALQRLLAD